jgi:hypothetical protein
VGLTHGVEVDSDCRQPPLTDLSFYYFSNPPFRLSFHLCVSRCTGVCPVGSSVERGSSGWSRVRSAAVVLRGLVSLITPYWGVSLTHHGGLMIGSTL